VFDPKNNNVQKKLELL